MYRTVPALCNRPEKKLNAQFVRYDGFHVIKPVYFHHQFRIRKLTIQEVKSYIAFAASKLLQGTNPSDEVRRNKFKRLRMRIKLREENSFITIPKANHSLLGLFTLCYASSLTQDVGGRASAVGAVGEQEANSFSDYPWGSFDTPRERYGVPQKVGPFQKNRTQLRDVNYLSEVYQCG